MIDRPSSTLATICSKISPVRARPAQSAGRGPFQMRHTFLSLASGQTTSNSSACRLCSVLPQD